MSASQVQSCCEWEERQTSTAREGRAGWGKRRGQKDQVQQQAQPRDQSPSSADQEVHRGLCDWFQRLDLFVLLFLQVATHTHTQSHRGDSVHTKTHTHPDSQTHSSSSSSWVQWQYCVSIINSAHCMCVCAAPAGWYFVGSLLRKVIYV